MSPRSGHVDTPLTNNNNSNGDNGVAIFGFCLAARSAYTVIVECVFLTLCAVLGKKVSSSWN